MFGEIEPPKPQSLSELVSSDEALLPFAPLSDAYIEVDKEARFASKIEPGVTGIDQLAKMAYEWRVHGDGASDDFIDR